MDTNKRLFGKRLSGYPIIGRGVYGIVYQINQSYCLKVNKSKTNNLREVRFYKRFKYLSLFPKMYTYGKYYIVLEYIRGISLKDYLESGKGLNQELLSKLNKMFVEANKAGLFLNPNARHTILTPDNIIKLVDLDDIIKFSSSTPYMLLNFFNKYGQKQIFLNYIKKCNKALYNKWKASSRGK